MAHPIVYNELHTTAPAAAKTFYRELFGWEMKDLVLPDSEYTEIFPGEGGGGAGLMAVTPFDGDRSHWLPYMAVPALEPATERAVALGAKLLLGKTEVPNTGWFTWLEDPSGARFALWQKA